MNPLNVIGAALVAFTEWCKTAAIRERRELRTEARSLRHEILAAADAGDARLLGELQNALADNGRDRAAILDAAGAEDSRGN